MASLDRHDAGQLLDLALRLRLAGHQLKGANAKNPFLRRARVLEKRALQLLSADRRFETSLQDELRG